jgi:hypothetical protein
MVDDIGSYLEKCLASMPHPNIAKTVRWLSMRQIVTEIEPQMMRTSQLFR